MSADTPIPLASYTRVFSIDRILNDSLNLEYKYLGATYLGAKTNYDGQPKFVIVSPSSGGTTPGSAVVGLNPAIIPYMRSGNYEIFLEFASVAQPERKVTVIVMLQLLSSGRPTIAAVTGSAHCNPTSPQASW